MLNKYEKDRKTLEIVNLDDIVPKNHLLRKVDAAVDFDRLYEIVEDLYCADNGRPSIDPVVLFKIVLIQHLYGIRSLRQTAEQVNMNIAYRWFIGYPINKSVPHFATISYNFRHRFTEETVTQIFEWILGEVEQAGYLEPEVVFVDGTHIKANANMKKKVKESIPVAARTYEKQLRKEVNEDREKHGKKPFDDDPPDDPPKEKVVTKSTTDPDSGVFRKGEHKRCFAYCAQTVCDSHNFILGVTVNPGNMHDSVAFDAVYDEATKRFPQVKVITADAGYKTPWICKKVFDDERIPSMPYKRPMTKKGFFKKYEYVYDEYYDCVICPENQILKYSTTNRDGYREYKSNPKICQNCSSREQCTASKNCQKVVTLHIWSDYIDRAEDVRHSPIGKATYEKRSETIERVFADSKEKYAMRYAPYRGLAQVTNWVKLKYSAMNLKKLAMWRWRDTSTSLFKRISLLFHSISSLFNIKNPVAV